MTPYWHVQRLMIGELGVTVARGLAPGAGIGLRIPARLVRDRIRFEDLSRRRYTPPSPDTHHRNETLSGLGDPEIIALVSRRPGVWTVSLSLGVSVPLGRTESNPFALGRRGLPHQHIQFGTGTWDPLLNVSAGHPLGSSGVGVTLSASAKSALYENARGYRAGGRYALRLGADRRLGPRWGVDAAIALDREDPEKWSRRIEEEGNIGRTDLMASLGIGRTLPNIGSVGLTLQVPLETWAGGEQVKYPVIVAMQWTH